MASWKVNMHELKGSRLGILPILAHNPAAITVIIHTREKVISFDTVA